jgi:hypothetical protein
MADPWEELQTEAVAIVAAAADRGVTLRVVGSAGIRLHCAAPGPLMDRLGRPAKDIDFVVPQRHRKGMRRLLEDRGYVIDRDLLIAMEGTRYSFAHRHDADRRVRGAAELLPHDRAGRAAVRPSGHDPDRGAAAAEGADRGDDHD